MHFPLWQYCRVLTPRPEGPEKKIYPVPGGPKRYQTARSGTAAAEVRREKRAEPARQHKPVCRSLCLSANAWFVICFARHPGPDLRADCPNPVRKHPSSSSPPPRPNFRPAGMICQILAGWVLICGCGLSRRLPIQGHGDSFTFTRDSVPKLQALFKWDLKCWRKGWDSNPRQGCPCS
jgi:hypothetical protein